MEREFSGALGGPTVSTPNSQHTSPSRSLSGQFQLVNSFVVEVVNFIIPKAEYGSWFCGSDVFILI